MGNPNFSRRGFIIGSGLAVSGTAAAIWWAQSRNKTDEHHGLSLAQPKNGDEALERLIAGNKCYVDEHFSIGDEARNKETRTSVAERQTPFALVLACSDSRVSPEVIFNAGLGELFVVRVAGNIVDPHCYAVVGSIEYAVAELKVPLIMVLGHGSCGAVKAAIRVVKEHVALPSSIGVIAESIRPVVEGVEDQSGDIVQNAVAANVRAGVRTLNGLHPIVAEQIESERLKVTGAVYDLRTGYVRLL